MKSTKSVKKDTTCYNRHRRKKAPVFFAFNNSQTEFKHGINNLGYRL